MLPPPFRVPPFLLGVAVRQKGLVTLRSIRRKRRMATVHWTVAFEFSSPFYWEYKNGVSPKGYTVFGTPEGTRTPDLLIRSQSLYPTELPAHTFAERLDIVAQGGWFVKFFFGFRGIIFSFAPFQEKSPPGPGVG